MSQSRVIVVGSGLAGLSAACELLEKGCNVTLLEKEQNLGGNSTKATTGIAAPGSALQQANGIKDDSADLLQGEGPEAQALVKEGTKDLQWLTKFLGVDSELVLRPTPGHKVPRTIATSKNFPGSVITYAAIHVLGQIATAKPDRLEMLVNTRVLKLTTNGNQVTGVEVLMPDGSKKTMTGSVILATGGFSGDFSQGSIMSQYAKQFSGFPTTNDERANGDGIKLGMAVGAGTSYLDKIQLTPTAANIPGQASANFKLVLSDAIIGAGARLLDATGRRFCNEMATSAERVDAMMRCKAPFRLVITADQAVHVEWLIQFYTQRKVMEKFNSARDLAGSMGVAALDPAIPANAVLYVAMVTPALYTCSGGLSTGWQQSTAGKVLAQNGQPIQGLFAAGETTSVNFQRLWSVSGIPLLHAIYSGRMAGRSAAASAGGGQAMDLRDIIISSLTSQNKAADEDSKGDSKALEDLTKEELIAKVKDLEANGGGGGGGGSADAGITPDEVKKHNTNSDAWMIINGNVVNVTNWIALHPGGEQAVTSYLGQDASEEWNAIHKPNTLEKNLVEEGGKGPWLVGKVGSGGGGGGGGKSGGDGGLTMEEVGKHNTESDVWVVLAGRAYDVTKWTQVHPGGVAAIMAYAGKDATDEWNCIHKPGTIEKNMYPASPNGAVDMGPVSGASAAAAPTGPVDDTPPPPDGDGGCGGILGAIIFLIKNIVLMLLRTVFFTGNFKIDSDRKGTIRSACFLLTFTIVHVLGNFVGMVKGPNEANGEGYFFDRLAWTGGFGIWKEGPVGLSAVELYLAFALLLHVLVALKRSWEISINYCLYTGRWNMLLSGLVILFFLTMHLRDLRFSSEMTYTKLRPPPTYVAWDGVMEGRVFFETDESIPLVRVRNLYGREVELFKDLGKSTLYTACIVVFWCHMMIGWKKLVPADAMQIPKDHVAKVVYMGWLAATAIASMYISVVWYTYFAPAQYVELVD